jgi:Fe-S cluster assembly protein SufD
MSALLESLLQPFDSLPLRDAAGLGASRRAAIDAVRVDGLPQPRMEAWKYTSLRALERRAFGESRLLPDFDVGAIALPDAPRLVFVNGVLAPALSDSSGLDDGVTLQPLSTLLQQMDADNGAFQQRDYPDRAHGFPRLNAALATEGVVLRVREGAHASRPVHLVLIGAPAPDAAWHLRHRIELAADSSLVLVEHRIAAGSHAHLGNEIANIQIGRAARLDHARVQRDSDDATLLLRTDAVLAERATYSRLDLELGAALSRHELNVVLAGARARLQADGVLLANGRRHLDTRLGIDHLARDSACSLTWRGLGAGRGRAVFHGGIVIREGADGCEAELSNKNLLLSEGAEIDTQPVLEIHADEVKAAHGATVGRLDPTSLFYLRSRGIPAAQATAMLTAAFCRAVVEGFAATALRESLVAHLDRALLDVEGAR